MLWEGLFIMCLGFVRFGNSFPVRQKIAVRNFVEDPAKYHLPENLKPIHYDLTIEPNLDQETFNGTVIIDVKVVEATKAIVLHKNRIDFSKENVSVSKNNKKVKVTKLGYDDSTHFSTISLESGLVPNDLIQIVIKYTGKFARDNRLVGFYIGDFVDEVGVLRKFANTQFEPVFAREAFPCFDQPNLKAKFTIHIIRRTEYGSLSNMPQSGSVNLGSGRIQDNYHTTNVVISTYLVAFVVSQFEKVSNGIYGVYGRPSLIHNDYGKYALDNTALIMNSIIDFIGVNYSLPKLDHVAISKKYFVEAAMENWGLVTYRWILCQHAKDCDILKFYLLLSSEPLLLYRKEIHTAQEKQDVLTIISHELGHQWFGNLATPKWWNVVWLSEGFATYFEKYIVEQVDPSMKVMDQYVTLVNHVALAADTRFTRPLNHDLSAPEDIRTLFDEISYQKGGTIVRMIEHIVSTDVFRAGLKNYLTNMNQKPATTADLWKGFQDIIDKLSNEERAALSLDKLTISEIMETWVVNPGYPVVTAKRDGNGDITFSQDRFLGDTPNSGLETLWTIPINYAEENTHNFGDTKTQFWLKTRQASTLVRIHPKKWFIVNKQETGYYRVNYDITNWNLIINYLNSDNFDKIHVANRAQLVDDSFSLAMSGMVSYEIPIMLCQYLTRETEYVPLVPFDKYLDTLNVLMSSSNSYPSFKNYINNNLRTKFKDPSLWEKDTHVETFRRDLVIKWLCRFEDKTCMDSLHKKLMSVESVEPDLQTPVYCGGMRLPFDSEKKFKKLYAIYRNEDKFHYSHRDRALEGIGCSLDKAFLIRFMTIIIGEDSDYNIEAKHRYAAFASVYKSSEIGMDQAVTFLVNRFQDVKSAFKLNELATILSEIGSQSSSNDHSKKLGSIKDEEFSSAINDAIESIDSNNKMSYKQLAVLHTWFDRGVPRKDDDHTDSAELVTLSISLAVSMLALIVLV